MSKQVRKPKSFGAMLEDTSFFKTDCKAQGCSEKVSAGQDYCEHHRCQWYDENSEQCRGLSVNGGRCSLHALVIVLPEDTALAKKSQALAFELCDVAGVDNDSHSNAEEAFQKAADSLSLDVEAVEQRNSQAINSIELEMSASILALQKQLDEEHQRNQALEAKIAQLEKLQIPLGEIIYDLRQEEELVKRSIEREIQMNVNRPIIANQQNIRFTPKVAKHLGLLTVELAEATGYDFSVTDLVNITAEALWEYRQDTPGFLCRLRSLWTFPSVNSREELKNWARLRLLEYIRSCRMG